MISRHALSIWGRRALLRLRKREKVLTFLAALIVFATFIVNDRVRSNLRDQVEAVQNARAFYEVYAGEYDIEAQIDNFQEDFSAMDAARKHDHRHSDVLESIRQSHETARFNNKFVSLYGLLEQVPNSQSMQELEALKSELDMENRPGNSNPLLGSATSLNHYNQRLFEAEQTILDRAFYQLLFNRLAYKIWTIVAYLLYAFAWCLGLATRLASGHTDI